MKKLHELIDSEISEKNSSKQDIIDYITEKYLFKYDEEIISEAKFISKIILNRLIEYRKDHADSNYNKTIGLIANKYVAEIVTEIRDIKSTWFGKLLFFFFKGFIIK